MPSIDHAHDELSIPTVTENDLANFHTLHFGPHTAVPPAPAWFSSSSNQNTAHDESVETCDNAFESELGFYSDGVQRTLTDEQIAIFRHSEIQALLREQRREREYERECEEEPGTQRSSPRAAAEPVHHQSHAATSTTKIQPPAVLPGERPTARKRRKKSHKPAPYGPSTKSLHVAPEDPQGRTTRRLAREMDEVQAESVVDLDY